MSKEALILFSNDPGTDAGFKSAAGSITRSLLEQILTSNISGLLNASCAHYDCFVSTEDVDYFSGRFNCKVILQTGNSFGERLARTLSDVFDLGYSSICVAGNDTPRLYGKEVKKSFEQLTKNDAVIGPSSDGGFYILTITREAWNSLPLNEFESLPYQTGFVLERLRNLFTKQNIAFAQLRRKKDIDKCGFVCAFLLLKRTVSERLNSIFNAIIKAYIPAHSGMTLFQKISLSFKIQLLKPPPICS